MNQFGQKKKFEEGEKPNLGKTHFGGYSCPFVCDFLNRGFFTVFLAFLGFFTAKSWFYRFFIVFCRDCKGFFSCIGQKKWPKFRPDFQMLYFLAKFL
jgi:hypothetical protein